MYDRMHIFPDRSSAPVALGRGTLIGLVAVGMVLGLWALGATWAILSSDEIGQRLFVRETEMRLSYEDRLHELSGHLEKEVTQNMVERTRTQERLDALAAKQAEIETRQAWLRDAADKVAGQAVREGASVRPPARPAMPIPAEGEGGFKLRDRLSALEAAAERVGTEERAMVASFGQAARMRVSRLRSAIGATGVDLRRPAKASAVGGPLVALPEGARHGQVGSLLADLDVSFSELAQLQSTANALPLGSPLAGDLDQTSSFGYRLDPFTRGPALHTGVDFRAETGTPAHATAAGRVVSAEYAGGYGLMVELDHGGGLTTRYGHLSAVSVVPGEQVRAGQAVGRAGSTGRSTGSHLHYETRINGEPVNPIRFLEAGRQLRRADG
jgi:murein DD-endopeptidase MepM/ murein hydrolase activator NlpD